MRSISRLLAAGLTILSLAGCTAGGVGRIEPPEPPTASDTAAQARKDFREAMALARAGHMAAAAPYYRKAAENGHVEAQYILATMYRTGRGLPRDMAQAVKWYGRSAEGGYPMAQFTLGNMHLKGDGVPRNVPMALVLLGKAAEQGHPQAQYNLGVYYYSQGGQAGYRKAENWFLSAAGQGESSSQYALGRLYSTPHDGVRLDRVRAYAWYSLAAANGNRDAATAAAELETRLSAAEKASARAMARRFAVGSTK